MWNMIMAITSPWVGLLLLWFFLLVFFFSQCNILLSGIVSGKTERPFGKWLLQSLKSMTLRSGFWLGGLNKFPPKKIQTAKISFREGCYTALDRVGDVKTGRCGKSSLLTKRQSMLCPPSTSFAYPPIHPAHLLCWKLPLFDCLGGSYCGTCKRWAMVGKGQRAGGMRGTRNPKKGNKIRGAEWEEWGLKKKG